MKNFLTCVLIAVGATQLPAQTNVFPSSGGVGIGMTAPSEQLEMAATQSINVKQYAYAHFGSDYSTWSTIVGNNVRARRGQNDGMELASSYVNLGASAIRLNWGVMEFHVANPANISSSSEGTPFNFPRMVVAGSGNVGIGTTSPQSKLSVSSASAPNGETLVTLEPSSNPTESTRIAWSRSDGWTPAAIGEAYSEGQNYGGILAFYTHPDDGQVGNQSSPVERMRILANGDVGVGITLPESGMHLKTRFSGLPSASGTTQQNAVLRLQPVDTNLALDFGTKSATGAWLQAANRTDLSQNFPLLLNPNGGHVAVGDPGPALTKAIELIGNSGGKIGLLGVSGVGGFHGLMGVTTSAADGDGIQLGQFQWWDRNATIGNRTVARIYAGLSGTVVNNRGTRLIFSTKQDGGSLVDAMVIDRFQNVGIGIATPTHKLSVNGTIRAKEVIVDTGWADHVFAADYRLAPLSEVEAHIKAEKHLPGIPSAGEVAEHGVNMGEMQAKLLAKVEELTLHLIRLEKENAVLRTENSRVQERLQRLESR